jgi:2-hydroxymethylglutarate dehydrogenase
LLRCAGGSKPKEKDMRIGFVGTGRIGNPICQNLIRAGFELQVLDVNPEAYRNLIPLKARIASSLREVGQNADIIMTSLPSDEIVKEVIVGQWGILESVKPGCVVLDLSTTSPQTIRGIGAEAAKRGIPFLDSPVSGGVRKAKSATLSIMVGGEKTVFEQVKPVLEKIARNVYYVGRLGAGQSLKLVNNLLTNLNRLAMAEGLVLGVKAGIDPEMLVKVIRTSSGNSFVLEELAPDILHGHFESEESSVLKLACKTLKLIADMADDLNVPLYLLPLAKQVYNFAKCRGLGDEIPSAVIKLYEEATRVRVRATRIGE